MITIPETVASFLLIIWASPYSCRFGEWGPQRDGASGFVTRFSIAFCLLRQVAIKQSGLPHYMHLFALTRLLNMVWFVRPHFQKGSVEADSRLLGGPTGDFFQATHSLDIPRSFHFLFCFPIFNVTPQMYIIHCLCSLHQIHQLEVLS